MPKNILFNKAEAIKIALEIFWEKGYESTSLTDLTEELEIGKGSFYNTFKSKRDLFEECINTYRTKSIENLQQILNAEEDIQIGVNNFLVFTLNDALNSQQHKGCFIANTCTELANSDTQIEQLISTHYHSMKSILAEYLNKQGGISLEQAYIKTNIIITFFIGLTVQFKLPIDENQLLQSIDKMIESLF